MATTFSKYDIVDCLKYEEEMTAYLEACFEEAGDDAAFIAAAVVNVARAYGRTQT